MEKIIYHLKKPLGVVHRIPSGRGYLFENFDRKNERHLYLTILVSLFCLTVIVSVVINRFKYENVQAQTLPQAAANNSCPTALTPKFGEKPDKLKGVQAVRNLQSTTEQIVKQTNNGVIDNARQRKQALVETMYRDPDKALKSILPSDQLTNLQSIQPGCFEKQAQFEGSLEVKHIDFFNDKVSSDQIILTTADKRKITLHPARGLYVPIESRTKVKVKGILLDDQLLFNASTSIDKSFEVSGGIDVISQPGNPPVVGEQKTLFLLVNFRNTTQPSTTATDQKNFLDTKIAPYYAANSYNKISVPTDVFGWYTIPIDQTCIDPFGSNRFYDLAIAAASADVDFTRYSHLFVIAPFGPNCSIGGISTIGKIDVNTPNGVVAMSESSGLNGFGFNLVAHELGHGFGMNHANSFGCGSVTFPGKDNYGNDTGCTLYGYGDRYDVMGSGNNQYSHFNALHKDYAGWFDSTTEQLVTSSGNFVLEPIESSPSGNLKALKIQRTETDYLYVEYRYYTDQRSAYLHVPTHSFGSINPGDSGLLDASPPYSAGTEALLPGSSTVDPLTGTKITVVSTPPSTLPSTLTVNVILGKIDFIPPTVKITSPNANTNVSGKFNITADANDVSGIQKVEYYWSGSTGNILVATATGASYQAEIDTTRMPNGRYLFYAKAYDNSGVAFGAPNNFALSPIQINVANVDSSPPSITLTNPRTGSALGNDVFFSAFASDNTGIDRVRFVVDGCVPNYYCQDDFTSPYSTVTYINNGNHTVFARAYDFAGNTTDSATVSFIVVSPTPTPTPSPTPSSIPIADLDGDGCFDVKELGTNPNFGGGRDPANPWDFYDVGTSRGPTTALGDEDLTLDHKIDVQDAYILLDYFGVGSSDPRYKPKLDRYIPDINKPYKTAQATDGIDLVDVLANLKSSSHSCL